MKKFIAAAAVAIVTVTPAIPAAAQDAAPDAVQAPAKITDKNHPDFVRCRTEPVIGSRAKKRRTCLTNRQWEEFARRGNDVARRTVEENAAGITTN